MRLPRDVSHLTFLGGTMFSAAWRCAMHRLACVLVVVLAVCEPAPAQNGQDIDALARIGRLPAEAELVILVRDAASLAASPHGSLVARDLLDSPMLAQTQAAWKSLSQVLNWHPDVAFERLLGGQMILIGAGLSQPSAAQWVIVSDVTIETETHLHKRLRAAPRGALAGQTVLALEDGDVELAVIRQKPVRSARGRESARTSTIVLARGGRTGLFSVVVESLAGRPGERTLSEGPSFEAVVEMGVGEIVAMYQSRPAIELAARGLDVAGVAGSARFAAISATRTPQGLRASLRASPSLFGLDGATDVAKAAWTDAPLRQLTPDAVLLIMGVGSEAVRGLGEVMGVSAVDAAVGEPMGEVMSRRWLMALHQWNMPEDDESRLAWTLGLETRAVGEFAAEADHVMGRVIEAINGDGDEKRAGPDFGGILPQATRKSTLTGAMMTSWAPAFGLDPMLAWVSRPCRGEAPGADADSCGWWVATLNPSRGQPPRAVPQAKGPADWASFVVDVLADPGQGELKPRVSLGYAAASRLARWVNLVQGDPTGVLVAVRSIESIMWEAGLMNDDLVDGRLVITIKDGLAR